MRREGTREREREGRERSRRGVGEGRGERGGRERRERGEEKVININISLGASLAAITAFGSASLPVALPAFFAGKFVVSSLLPLSLSPILYLTFLLSPFSLPSPSRSQKDWGLRPTNTGNQTSPTLLPFSPLVHPSSFLSLTCSRLTI